MQRTVYTIARNPHPGQFSIENVFRTVFAEINEKNCDISFEHHTSRFRSRGIFRRLLNCLLSLKFFGKVCHILGDVTYLGCVIPSRHLIITFHDIELYERNHGIKQYIIGLIWFQIPLWRAKKVTFISDFTKDRILENFHVNINKTIVIPNPLPLNFQKCNLCLRRENKEKFEFKILQVGTKQNKNVGRVVQALKSLSHEFSISLYLVGSHQVNLSDEDLGMVKLHSIVGASDKDLQRLYNYCDVLLFASTYEGFGLPILEAQASGLCVVSSDLEPMKTVAGDGAYFVDPYSVSSIASGCRALFNSHELRESLVSAGYDNIARFSPARVASRYIEVYSGVLRSL